MSGLAQNKARNAEIIRRRQAGEWPRQIAAEMGIGKNVIIGVIGRAGLAVPGASRDHPLIGESAPNAVLTEVMVRAIRAEYRPGKGGHGARSIALKLGLNSNTVQSACSGRTWAHVQ